MVSNSAMFDEKVVRESLDIDPDTYYNIILGEDNNTFLISKLDFKTAKPIARKNIILSWDILNKVTNRIPIKAQRRWPNKTFFGWANSLSGYPKTTATVDPKDVANQKP